MTGRTFDTLVIGAGMVGSALGYGLARSGMSVGLLDGADVAFRAARGNFGLIWVQGKGAKLPRYGRWSQLASRLWSTLAVDLKQDTGIDVGFSRQGGLHLCLSDEELAARAALVQSATEKFGIDTSEFRLLDRSETRAMLPAIGPDVVGASYCVHDGEANPLYLLRALQQGFIARRGHYFANAGARAIRRVNHGFEIDTPAGCFRAQKVVISAGLGNPALAEQVGLRVPVRPVRGQIVVTEKLAPFLPVPTFLVRQMPEGGVIIGDSQEEVGFNDFTSVDVQRQIVQRGLRYFPRLRDVQIVRSWSALRVMSPDGLPVYDASRTHPGAYVVTCHSGVTLSSVHALVLAPAIAAGQLPEDLSEFSTRRFSHV